MALQKSSLPINFSSGLDTVTDPLQVAPGKFLELKNSVFTNQGLLQKRNGYGTLASLPDTTYNAVTTFNGNLTALGISLSAYSQSSNTWVNKGPLLPTDLEVLPLVRSSTNQTYADTAISPSGVICTVFTDMVPVAGTPTAMYKYVVADATTGQNLTAPALITVPSGTVTGSARVFTLGAYFVIVFTNVIAGVSHLEYIAISIASPTQVSTAVNLSIQYTPSSTLAFDGVVANNNLYLAWNGNDGGGAIRMTRLDSQLIQHNTAVFAGHSATIIAISADISGPNEVLYVASYNSGTSTGYIFSADHLLNPALAYTQIITAETVANITVTADNSLARVFYEVVASYSYDGAIKTDYIKTRTCTSTGTLGTASIIIRSIGLASKAFMVNNVNYFLGIYSSANQPTYFLINQSGQVVAKLAYANGGRYYVTGLPSVDVTNDVASVSYLRKDSLEAVNKTQGAVAPSGIYSQTGVNLVSFTLSGVRILSSEIGANLNLTGGFLWAYDGYAAVEQGFHLYPDYVEVTTSTTGGLVTDQQYFYQVTYEWSDNQGNIFRSAPSIPVAVTAAGGNTSSNTINVPTLRLTYKTANPAKIVIYRWSTAHQTYYQVTSIANPILNSTTVDSIAFVDTLADSSIIGNSILYTTGGVIENIGPPATSNLTLFQSRLFLVDAEDRNLLWYSKQVIEGAPVEMSDLLTIYVAPTAGAQGSTGPITALSALDDKLIIFKKDAIYYINGTGPDNTGANSQYSEPVFISSTVGCDNQQSIVFMPQGLMFQSDKGIWLLGRDLATTYIGAPVAKFATTGGATVQSAVNVPGTNQVRFTMSSGITLVYDYFYGQWGTFVNVPAISSTLYQNLHTYINSLGKVHQETPGVYLDGSNPVLMSFTTSWFNLAGLQGFERAYHFYLLGTYLSPHKLQVQIAYDYNPSPTQSTMILPDNLSINYGDDTLWGSTPTWGGQSNIEQWRVFMQQQKCQAFQLTISEFFDRSMGYPAGAGLTLSGINLLVGTKKSSPTLRANRSVG